MSSNLNASKFKMYAKHINLEKVEKNEWERNQNLSNLILLAERRGTKRLFYWEGPPCVHHEKHVNVTALKIRPVF